MMKLLTSEQVQEILGVGKDWLNSRVQKKEIPCIKLGHYVRFDPSDIKELIVKYKKDSLKIESEHRRKLRSRKPMEDLWQK